MDQVRVLRHKVLVEGLSRREVAQQLGLSRNTVRKYVEQDERAHPASGSNGSGQCSIGWDRASRSCSRPGEPHDGQQRPHPHPG
ncbi:MAG: helix-turn-helix domain-containing protein [Proteobacteria bacterium]|nr:helix-turn-helix domain-containing protein [Pseudomonadota bacterium]